MTEPRGSEAWAEAGTGGEVVLLCHGGFRPHRGLEQLIDGVALMDPSVRLVLRGFGPSEKALKERAARSPAADRIRFEAPVPMSEVVRAASAADIGIIPYLPVDANHRLCSPNKLFEYLRAGLAVVASDLVELRRVIAAEGIGDVYDPYSPADLARVVNALARDPARLRRAKANARKCRERYHWSRDATRLLDLYEHLSEGAGASAPGGPGGASSAPPPARADPQKPKLLVTITAFPVMGGMRSVLLQVQPVLEERYEVHYLTRTAGPDAGQFRVHTFGRPEASYFRFPGCLYYAIDGFAELWRLHRRHRFAAFVAQDILFTGLFTAAVGRLSGTRTVVMDHGSALVAVDPAFQRAMARGERGRSAGGAAGTAGNARPGAASRRSGAGAWSLREEAYRRLLPAIARCTTRLAREFLVDGDELVGVLRNRLGAPARRIREFPHTVDVAAFRPALDRERARIRAGFGLPADAVLVVMVNRLVKLKGLETAVPAIAGAIRETRRPAVFAVAGDGPDRALVERLLDEARIRDRTTLLGELGRSQVGELLAAADLFVYAGMHGTGTSLAILEAMASGCAVVATDVPASNADLLADGRGRVVPAGDIDAMQAAVRAFIDDDRARQDAGAAARQHVLCHHSRGVLAKALKHI